MSGDGVLLIDKPPGVTSHDIVARVRRARGVKRVGHAGTLDPFATGLLLVLVGRATRVQRFLMALPKRYEATARFGWTSSTGDPEGELVQTGRVPDPGAPLPTGVLRQRPPAYSAVKVGGERAYKRARRGEDVEPAEREVVVERFERTGEDTFAIACSSGTYVRTLIADLGDAYCTALRRTGIGPFEVADADPERLLPLDEALGFLPAVKVDGDAGWRAAHGQRIGGLTPLPRGLAQTAASGGQTPFAASGGQTPFRIVDPDGLVCLAEPRGDGELAPIVGFRG